MEDQDTRCFNSNSENNVYQTSGLMGSRSGVGLKCSPTAKMQQQEPSQPLMSSSEEQSSNSQGAPNTQGALHGVSAQTR